MTKINSILALLFLFFTYQATAQDDNLPPLLTVVGNGEAREAPDRVEVQLGVSLRNNSLAQVRNDADTRSSAIIAALRDAGVAASDIKTSYVSIQPYYSYNDNDGDPSPDYYSATKTLTFTLRDLSNFDNVMEDVYAAGANSVDSIEFKVEDEEGQKELARRRAVDNARNIANTLAEELGVEIGNVYSITDQTSDYNDYPRPYMFEAEAASDGSGPGPSISGGVVLTEASVQVKYYIVNPDNDDRGESGEDDNN